MENNEDIINSLRLKNKDTINHLSVVVCQSQVLKSIQLCNYFKVKVMNKYQEELDKRDT